MPIPTGQLGQLTSCPTTPAPVAGNGRAGGERRVAEAGGCCAGGALGAGADMLATTLSTPAATAVTALSRNVMTGPVPSPGVGAALCPR